MEKRCTFSALRDKEVINTADGCRLGYVCDLEIDPICGQIIALLIPGKGGLLRPGKCREIRIPWNCIVRIGDDLILVCLTGPPIPPPDKPKL